MKKYNIDKEIKILRFLKFKIVRPIIPLCNLVLTLFKDIKSSRSVEVKKHNVTSFDNKKIKVYEYSPRSNTQDALIYFHGGAFYLKGAPYHYKLAKLYAESTNTKVFFVDYRLSPKYKYPTSIFDGVSVYKWILENKEILEVDNIGVGGDSAGGSLAIDVSIYAKLNNIKLPEYQMLIYPVIDNKVKTLSKDEYLNTPMWNSKLNEKMWKYYLKDDEFRSPLDNFINIKTYIEVAEFDPLKDEGIMYYNYLKENGTQVILNETKGTVHGYDILYKRNIAKNNINKRIEFINASK